MTKTMQVGLDGAKVVVDGAVNLLEDMSRRFNNLSNLEIKSFATRDEQEVAGYAELMASREAGNSSAYALRTDVAPNSVASSPGTISAASVAKVGNSATGTVKSAVYLATPLVRRISSR